MNYKFEKGVKINKNRTKHAIPKRTHLIEDLENTNYKIT